MLLGRHVKWLGAAAALVASAATSGAQSPGADETTADGIVAQNLSSAPAAGHWLASANMSVQFQGGRSESLSYQLDVILARAYTHVALARIDAEVRRSEYSQPDAGRFTSEDNHLVSLTVIPRAAGRLTAIGVASWRRDHPVGLDHRVMAQAGPFLQLQRSTRLDVGFAPLIGIGRQDNANAGASERIVAFGGLTAIGFHPSATSSITVYAAAHRNVDLARDASALVNTSISAAVTRNISLTLYHSYSLEGVHPERLSAVQNNVGAGLTVAIAK